MTQDVLGDFKAYSLAGTDQEVQFITTVLNLPPTSSILDLYCGYGRHAIELAKLGFNVTGVDATKAFLDIASQKAEEEGVVVTFAQCDMRELDYCEEFDAVINMFAAFGYFSDAENIDVLKRVAKALRPHGLFLIDLLNRDWMVRNSLNRYWRHPSGEYVLSYKVELNQGVAIMKRELVNLLTGAKTQYEFVLRAYSLAEITAILAQAGFYVKQTYGGFDYRTYGVEAPRMIILAEKQT
ncbi:Methyltransferase type 11 [Thermosinus carboxydivorans Nor1]|uniref:Methyltransferase type 11 n=1 Tax=Thermosinus carboxydivorans Nor1 TaxID=401526 RepID=A1HTU2_9FIRM|nr:class I SAM-dependent methyltransferase [Thermosinus carboxydivorans]EAX46576.1 Methyltransferase type 11 [Thermosinus carboxydivorans Nor1]